MGIDVGALRVRVGRTETSATEDDRVEANEMAVRGLIATGVLAAMVLAALPSQASPDGEFVRVAADHWTFETTRSHQRFVPWGTNFVLYDNKYLNMFGPGIYDHALYDRVLAVMEALHINLVKAFLPIAKVLPDPQGPEAIRIAPGYLDNVADFLSLARRHHIRVVLSLAEWGGNEIRWWHEGGEYFRRSPWKAEGVDALAVLRSFWSQVGARFRDNPTLFAYEPCVEWSLPSDNLTWTPPNQQWGRLTTEPSLWYWRHWAVQRYGSLEALNKAWGTNYASVDDVALVDYTYDFQAHRYLDPQAKILAYQDFREWASYRYLKPQIEAIRRADPNHMATIANHMRPPGDLWEGAAQYFIGLSEPEESDLVDYMTHHDNHSVKEFKGTDYGALARAATVRMRSCLARKRMPIVLEEFSFDSPDPQQVADACSAMARGTVGECSGWMVWFFQAWEEGSPTGLVDRNLRPTAWGREFGDLGAPGGFIAKADLSRRRARQVITIDRASELVPARHGTLLQVLEHWDNYRHPVDYRWPRNAWITLALDR
jgi:hypothetical protein